VTELVVPASRLRRRVDRATARRLDRLSRAAHRFHRFAHHPLCGRYAGEVIRIGRIRLCRGCSYAIAGGLAGGFAGLAIGPSPVAAAVATLAGTAVLLATLWLRGRPSKLVTRLLPAIAFATALTTTTLAWTIAGLAVAVATTSIVIGLRVLYGKRGPDRTPCRTCPERDLAPCSGFAPIISRELAFQRVAARWLA